MNYFPIIILIVRVGRFGLHMFIYGLKFSSVFGWIINWKTRWNIWKCIVNLLTRIRYIFIHKAFLGLLRSCLRDYILQNKSTIRGLTTCLESKSWSHWKQLKWLYMIWNKGHLAVNVFFCWWMSRYFTLIVVFLLYVCNHVNVLLPILDSYWQTHCKEHKNVQLQE